jgi:hypothetical protein
MTWVLKQVRTYAPVIQGHFRKAAQVSDQVSRRVVSPFIGADAGVARARRCCASLFLSHPIEEV